MRAVEHLAVEPDDARVRVRREGGDDLATPGYRRFMGREGLVDHGDLRGVDRRFRGKAAALGGARFPRKTRLVAEIGEDGVDRRDPGRRRAEKAERAGE